MISTVVFGTTPLAGVILFLLALLIVVQWTERERLVVSLCTAGRVSARSHRPLPALDLALVLCLGLVRALEWKTPGGGGKVWAG